VLSDLYNAVLANGQERIVLKQDFRSGLAIGLNHIMRDDFIGYINP
jgi:hypothetical protein